MKLNLNIVGKEEGGSSFSPSGGPSIDQWHFAETVAMIFEWKKRNRRCGFQETVITRNQQWLGR